MQNWSSKQQAVHLQFARRLQCQIQGVEGSLPMSTTYNTRALYELRSYLRKYENVESPLSK